MLSFSKQCSACTVTGTTKSCVTLVCNVFANLGCLEPTWRIEHLAMQGLTTAARLHWRLSKPFMRLPRAWKLPQLSLSRFPTLLPYLASMTSSLAMSIVKGYSPSLHSAWLCCCFASVEDCCTSNENTSHCAVGSYVDEQIDLAKDHGSLCISHLGQRCTITCIGHDSQQC